MSADFRTIERVSFADVFDGRLERLGVREYVDPYHAREGAGCLTDGRNYVWVYATPGGSIDMLTRSSMNDPNRILQAIAEVFDTAIATEHEPQFWGCDTEEELHELMLEMSKSASTPK